jgi:MFS family permease
VSPIASYRRLFALAGPLYVVTAFLGRLPLAMSQMGALLLVSSTTGSYAAGGLAAGTLAVANAVCSPVAGALADRVGQRPVVLVQSVLGGLALATLVALAAAGSSTTALVAAAGVAGALVPQIGPLARVRWRPITQDSGLHQPRLVEAAFSYEGAADEASFVLGPAMLGTLVAVAAPGAGLLTAAVLLLVFGVSFALHPTARLAHAARPDHHAGGRLLTPVFAVLLLAQLLIGVIFGSVQTGTTVLATAAGQPGTAGLVHAVLGIGSVAAGLAIAALPERIGHATRVLATAAALFVLALPLLWTDSLRSLALVVLVLGFAAAPYMTSNFPRGARAAPAAKVGAAMTLLAAATGLGYAVGSATAGRLADASGHTSAFAVTVSAGAAALLLAALAQPLLRGVVRRPAEADDTPAVAMVNAIS